jgi:hypothetical protein
MKTPMISLRAIARLAMACATLAATTGCRDATNIVDTGQQVSKPSIMPRTNLVMRGDTALVTVWIDIRGDVGKIGSFTGRLRYDQTALEYGGEVATTDGTLRAVNPGSGEVRVAGASAAGVDRASLAVFRFHVRNASVVPGLQFDLDELHELSRADARVNVQRGVGSRTVR